MQHPTPPPSDFSRAPRLRLEFLDGLRALAALWVVLHHIWHSLYGMSPWPGWRGAASNWLFYGHLAVDVFIVLSGFCLMLPVARHGTLTGGALNFYRRRAWRILPPYFAALVVTYALRKIFFPTWNVPMLRHVLLAHALLLQDWFNQFNLIDDPTWSVAVEWKIYFLLPLFVWIWRRFGIALTLLSGAAIGYGITIASLLLKLAGHNTLVSLGHTCPWYVFLFTMGLCAGAAARGTGQKFPSRLWPWLTGLFALALAGLLYQYPITAAGEGPLFMPHYLLVDTFAGALTATALVLLSQINSRHPLLRLLSWRPLVFLGTFSYSIYLVHIVIVLICLNYLNGWHYGGLPLHARFLLADAAIVPLVIGISYLFFLAFERPFLVRRPRETPAEVARDAALSPAP